MVGLDESLGFGGGVCTRWLDAEHRVAAWERRPEETFFDEIAQIKSPVEETAHLISKRTSAMRAQSGEERRRETSDEGGSVYPPLYPPPYPAPPRRIRAEQRAEVDLPKGAQREG